MPEHVEPGAPPAVVELALGEDSEQRRLPDVETSEHRHPEVDVLLVVGYLEGRGNKASMKHEACRGAIAQLVERPSKVPRVGATLLT